MGEGALAYELQDALTRRLYPEHYSIPDNRQRLTYEWTYLLTSLYKLQERGLDSTLNNYPELIEYAYQLSARMDEIDDLANLIAPTDVPHWPSDALENLIKQHRNPQLFEVANDIFYTGEIDGLTDFITSDASPVREPLALEDLAKPRNIPKLLDIASDVYYAHNGLHETAWRSNRLETIAAIYDYHLKLTPYKVGDRTYISTTSEKRLAASVHEELAEYTTGERQELHENVAYDLNQEIIANELVPWYDQQKVHAVFSLYDIDFRRWLRPFMGSDIDKRTRHNTYDFAVEKQKEFYADLYQRSQYIEQLVSTANQCESEMERLLWIGRAKSLTGTIIEMQVLGELRDAIIKRQALFTIEARQSFLREDHNPRLPRTNNQKKLMHTPNFSFDLVLQAHGTRGPMSRLNIEVKKSHSPDIYLSGTYVLNAKDDNSTSVFSQSIMELADAKITYYEGRSLSTAQKERLKNAASRIKPHDQIDEVLSRAA